ncbi:SurA N-terminal domain-containing protein [Bradyrhizobium guangdongense]|uniref:Peptidyl-prolyl cis-trans isomerase, EpsD family n=1 Tax=Bradyrhizobium guangdongense TaxID=1325090 RepID=A0ABX6UE25_9BRAD|nr:SurA N-terminal domain-containing protein [Bradyrhizobium guangdongense]QAU38506.1 hypothetical protein X265_13105 [Bradyrhizobium guangdongense]QOZ59565.1 hypothetical protein XH86_13105 [Bradyrhizobium guangdongense]
MRNWPNWPYHSIAVVLCSAALLAGCGKKEQATAQRGQVVAHVGDEVITNQELENEFRLANIPPDKQKDPEIVKQVLGQLVTRKYLLQQALNAKLDREPGVLLDLLRAREQVLENAYLLRRVMSKPPTKADIDRYIADNPAKFSNRKLLQVDQIAFPLGPAAQSVVESSREAKSLDELDQQLTAASIPHGRQSGVLSSGDVGPELFDKIEAKKADDVFFVRSGQNGIFFKVLGEETRPLEGQAAANQARQLMRNDALKGEIGIATYSANMEAKFEGEYQQIMQGQGKGQ